MAHNIFFNEHTGKYSFFSVKEKAWHGLGQVVADYPTSAEAIQHAGLDYEVAKTPLYTKGTGIIETPEGMEAGGEEISVPDYFATIRTDNNTALGVVGKDYQIIQNKDAFSFFDAIVGGDEGILYETAGALGKGERIFITAKLPGYISVGKDDLIEKYLFLTTSHDGSGSIMAAFTPIRIVCNNTLNAALRHCSNAIRIRHTSNAKQRLEQAHKVMGIANRLSGELEGIFNEWANMRIEDKELRKLIQMAMAPGKEVLKKIQENDEDAFSTVFKNTCEEVFAYGMMNETQQMETTKGTLFGAFNSITGYFQNVRSYKDEEAKLKSLMFGGTAALRTQKAFNLCGEFAKSGSEIFNLN